MYTKQTFPVAGMHCAGCAHNVEQTLNGIAGVEEANVNLASGSVLVTYDEKLSPEVLAKAVSDAGYELIVAKDEKEEGQDQYKRTYYNSLVRKMILAWILVVPIFLLSMFGGNLPLNNAVVALASLVVLAFCGNGFYTNAIKQLRHKKVSMDTLVALSTFVDYVFSLCGLLFPFLWSRNGGNSPLYFDAAAMIVAFVLLGKVLEERAKRKTGSAIDSLIKLVPQTALRVLSDGSESECPVEELKKGDKIRVRAGESIAVDGIVVSGTTFVDESMMSGEPIPVEKTMGSHVVAGTINGNGSVVVEAQSVGRDTVLSHIIKTVEEAQGSKAPIQRIADKVVAIFVPAVLAVSLLTLVVWLAVGGFSSLTQAVVSAVSVLVIACPCSLGLATPTAIMVGIGRGAKIHVLFRDAVALETMSKADAVVFDKTGTITEGKLDVAEKEILADCSAEELKALMLAENMSNHPLAKSLANFLKTNYGGAENISVSQFENISGQGITFSFNGKNYWTGNEKMVSANGADTANIKIIEANRQKTSTLVWFGEGRNVLAVFALQDKLKADSAEMIAILQKDLGKHITLLSGDRESTTRNIAKQLGIEDAVWAAEPNDKDNKIKELQSHGYKVAMVGDGTNDSEALARADVSVAMGKGTDVAINTAQVVLMDNSLGSLVKAFKLSKETVGVIKRNLFWAFVYNVIGIPIAAGVLYPVLHVTLSPIICAAAMAFSSVSVVLSSLTLYSKKI